MSIDLDYFSKIQSFSITQFFFQSRFSFQNNLKIKVTPKCSAWPFGPKNVPPFQNLAKDLIFKKKMCKFKTILLLSIRLFSNTHFTNITIRDKDCYSSLQNVQDTFVQFFNLYFKIYFPLFQVHNIIQKCTQN